MRPHPLCGRPPGSTCLQAALAQALGYTAEHQAQFHGFGRLWRIQDLLVGLVLFFFAGVPNLERAKALHRREFGLLLARRRSLSCWTLQRNLPWLTAGNVPAELHRLVGRQLLALGWVEPGQWQLDGHFFPYHGPNKRSKDY